MNITKLQRLTNNLEEYSGQDVASLKLMSYSELEAYQKEVEIGSENLCAWDHIRATLSFKEEIYQQQEKINYLRMELKNQVKKSRSYERTYTDLLEKIETLKDELDERTEMF